MPMYALFANDKHIMDVWARDTKDAAKQLKKLGQVFTSFNNQQVKYYATPIDATDEDVISSEVMVIKGLANKVEFKLVKQ